VENAGKLRRMSEEDVNLAKARAQNDYVECRARLSALQNEAGHYADLLEEVCRFLRAPQERFATGELEDALQGKVIALMNSLHEARQRRAVLHKTLVDMGLDLKD
jgi:hypothetical protein